VGLILIAVEIFIIPGFGVAGALGITFAVIGLTLSLLNNVRFNFENVDTNAILIALLTVTLSLFFGFLLALWLSRKLFTINRGPLHSLALHSEQTTSEGYVAVNTQQFQMTGKTGTAQTVLRPSGKIVIENEIWDAKSEDGFIDKGEPVRVIRHEAGQLYVEKA
jgi:membrane-bound serine protease (ClpP class)